MCILFAMVRAFEQISSGKVAILVLFISLCIIILCFKKIRRPYFVYWRSDQDVTAHSQTLIGCDDQPQCHANSMTSCKATEISLNIFLDGFLRHFLSSSITSNKVKFTCRDIHLPLRQTSSVLMTVLCCLMTAS